MASNSDQRVHRGEIDWEAGGIETELGWSLQATYQGFSRAGSVAVAPVPGGPRGYQVLVAVTTEELTSQLALAHRLSIDKNAMTTVVDDLEAGGFVERRPDPADRRIRQVVATEVGRSLLATARVALHEAERVLMRDLDDDEQQQLRHLLARVALGADDFGAVTASADETHANTPKAAPHRSHRHFHSTGQ